MKRAWFQDKDGTYYRNCPLIMAELERISARAWPWLMPRCRALAAEWEQAFSAGVIRKPALGRRDVLREPGSFREAYPRHPGLWVLDEMP